MRIVRSFADLSHAFGALVGLLAVGTGVWTAIQAGGSDRHVQGYMSNRRTSTDTPAEPVGRLPSLRALAGRLEYCRTATKLSEENDRSNRGVTRLPSAVARKRTQQEPRLPVDRCAGVLYTWSRVMPLSGRGIVEISEAARNLGIALAVLDAAELHIGADSTVGDSLGSESTDGREDIERALAAELIAAGATVHYPTIIMYREGRLVGEAIAGDRKSVV